MGFSLDTKHEMMDRAEGKSELSGRREAPLEAMHFNHTKNDTYDDMIRGLIVRKIEHYAYHELFSKNPKKYIGLTKKRNREVLRGMLASILFEHNFDNKSFEEIAIEIQEARENWGKYFSS